jgi:PAS domain S-box-containing protein
MDASSMELFPKSMILGLINNAALLITLAFLYDSFSRSVNLRSSGPKRIALSLALGGIAMAVMLNPWELRPGLFFDTRSILLGVTGLFFGLTPTILATLMVSGVRLAQGGIGLSMGLGVIVVSSSIGLAWGHWRGRDLSRLTLGELFIFGIVLHLAMLACVFMLPSELAWETFGRIALPVLVIYPLATAALGNLLVRRYVRNQVARRLEESESRYQSLFEDNHAVMLLIDPETEVIVDANPAASAFYGWPRERLRGMDLAVIHDPSLNEGSIILTQTVKGQSLFFQGLHRLADGRIRDVEVYGGPLRYLGRMLLYTIVVDSSSRKEVERNLMESEKRFRLVVESAPNGIFVQARGQFAYLNTQACQCLGVSSPERLLGTSVLERFAFEDRGKVAERIRQLNEHRKAVPLVEESMLRLDGTCFMAEVAAVPISWDGVDGALVFFWDITDRKKTEDRMRLNEARLQSLFTMTRLEMASMDDLLSHAVSEARQLTESRFGCVFVLREEDDRLSLASWSGRVDWVCEGLRLGEGYSLDELEPWSEAVRQCQPLVVYGRIKAGLVGRHEQRSRDAARRSLCVPVVSDGTVTALLVVADKDGEYDASDIRQASLLMDALWRMVARKRDAEALLVAKEAAEKASRAKSEFLANMSHELRTPLNGIQGMTQLLALTELTAEQQEYVDAAMTSCRRLTRLLGDILDLSRVESGKLGLMIEPFSLEDCIAAMTAAFEPACLEAGLTWVVDVAPGTPRILRGDEGRVRQILYNLIGNAVKFTRIGGVRLEIAAGPTNRHGERYILFTVTDTGIGIPADQLEQIFEAFHQVERSFTRRFQGAGLGLAIVRRLVLLMGGCIAIESKEGGGTECTCALPLYCPVESRAEQSSPDAREETPTLTPLRKRILVAEDDTINALAVRRLLEKMGHAVFVAKNGREAVEMAHDIQPDVIFMDVGMPLLDGVQASVAIREAAALSGKASVPIIALTAHVMAGDREWLLDVGMDGYLAKPVDRDNLVATLGKVLSGKDGVTDTPLMPA